MTSTAAPGPRPGAMSLLDKFASINASIDDARRRVAEFRSSLERANDRIQGLREERNGMAVEAERAAAEKSRLESDLREAREAHRAAVAERDRAERERQVAASEEKRARKRVDDERAAFLERCREFRASCKRMRVAASILVLDGGGSFDAKADASDEQDLWRRLQDEEFSDDDEEEEDGGRDSMGNDEGRSNKRRKPKRPDPEVELAEKEERGSRQALIEAECALHAERMKNDDAVRRNDARNQRLVQQRAQLLRHRKEVEELEREIQSVKDGVVKENQMAKSFEADFNRKKSAAGRAYSNSSSNNHGSYSNHYTPHDSRDRSTTVNNPYAHRTPQNASSSAGYQQQRSGRPGNVANPYAKQGGRTANAAPPPQNYANSAQRGQGGNRGGGGAGSSAPRYASDMLSGSAPEYGHAPRGSRDATQHPHRGGRVRDQRQFGTSVGVSLDSGMTDELRNCMAAFSSEPKTSSSGKARDDDDGISDVSSTSSDEEILSFTFFGNKK